MKHTLTHLHTHTHTHTHTTQLDYRTRWLKKSSATCQPECVSSSWRSQHYMDPEVINKLWSITCVLLFLPSSRTRQPGVEVWMCSASIEEVRLNMVPQFELKSAVLETRCLLALVGTLSNSSSSLIITVHSQWTETSILACCLVQTVSNPKDFIYMYLCWLPINNIYLKSCLSSRELFQ